MGPIAIRALTSLAIGGWFLGLMWLEKRRPLRQATEEPGTRLVRNSVIAGSAAALSLAVESPISQLVSQYVYRRRMGLLNQRDMPIALQVLLSVALLDYTLYIWHVLSHKVPLLWRCHVVHHIDLDLDASTAVRFHFSELALSVFWRVLQVRCLGINPGALSLWQAFLMFNILFHHSNVRLPWQFEAVLNWLIVTPRMHGIHHSIIDEETNANWSSGLTVWDRVHH